MSITCRYRKSFNIKINNVFIIYWMQFRNLRHLAINSILDRRNILGTKLFFIKKLKIDLTFIEIRFLCNFKSQKIFLIIASINGFLVINVKIKSKKLWNFTVWTISSLSPLLYIPLWKGCSFVMYTTCSFIWYATWLYLKIIDYSFPLSRSRVLFQRIKIDVKILSCIFCGYLSLSDARIFKFLKNITFNPHFNPLLYYIIHAFA